MLLTVRWGQFKPSQPSRRVAKVGPNQTVTTTPRHPRRRGHFKPPSRGQIRLSRPLAECRARNGDLDTADAEFEELLADERQISERVHSETLITRINLLGIRSRGDSAAAVIQHEELLADALEI